MKVTQVYEFVNTAMNEAIGDSFHVLEDLSNVVDAGTALFNANAVDAYVKSLINHIGKVVFVDRTYSSTLPNILRDGWEYGSVLEKVQMDLLDAEENESWDLVDGKSYDPHIFHQPKAEVKFYNSKLTFEIPISITEMQVKQSFSNAGQLNGFISMIFNTVAKSITIKMDELIMRVINDLIAKTIYDAFPDVDYTIADYTDKTGVRAINLLKVYNDTFGTQLLVSQALKNADFIRFAAYNISLVSDRLTKINTIYNIGGKARFTPKDMQHIVLLSEFEKAASVYLYSDVYHNELVKLPNADTVPFWQGPGNKSDTSVYDLVNTGNILVKTSDGNDVNVSGVIGVIFDRDAAMVANQYSRVTSDYNAKAEFTNYFYKEDVSLFNDTNEQTVVFFVA